MNTETIFRIITVVVLVSAISISVYFRHQAEKQGGRMRTTEGQGLVKFLRLYGLLALLPLFGYLINPDWVAWARLTLPEWLRWLAAAVALACIPLVYWIFSSIGNNISPTQATRQNHQLITHGPYRWVRHPLYSVGTLMFLAISTLTALWWLVVALAPGLAILLWRTPKEEARLIETFGETYRQYMQRTGRFIPRFR
ncbi:MAG: isoprenylcysteine carboxylmethyltransferase family protein [Anaerolineales bacterium]|nr:isoprenylcysteine carboxylmethyltransferase family protein [Anaerolineales bacterium]